MKKISKYILAPSIMIFTIVCNVQGQLPRFEKDTLYTSSGFKIYKGQKLTFAKGTGRDGAFRYVRVVKAGEIQKLTDNSVIVKKLWKYNISYLGNAYIMIKAYITYKDGSKGEEDFNLAFDLAIENFPGLPAELVVPEQFTKAKISASEEISKLYKLFQDSIITKDQFEAQKAKILNN